MRLMVTGATGLVGRRLVADRLERGDEVLALTRSAARAASRLPAHAGLTIVEGDPTTDGAWQEHVDGCDGVVHLAGAGVGDRRWTDAYMQEIKRSRVEGTQRIVAAIRAASRRPRTLVCASAVSIYGDGGDCELDETSPPRGEDFLAEVTRAWEAAAMAAESDGVRVVLLRTGLVLDARAELIRKVVPPFRFFVGGPIGSGRQYMPWIHWRDLVGLVDLALTKSVLRGPLNGAAPTPVTSRAFSRAVGRILRRPSWLPVPYPVLRLVMGRMARYAVMSYRMLPARALELGYEFAYPDIDAALCALIVRSKASDSGT